MKLIGKGSFTKAYLSTSEDTVYLITNDPIKECMAHGWFPECALFPVIRVSDVEPYDYMMEYYPLTKGLKSFLDDDQYQIYNDLRNVESFSGHNKHDAYWHYFQQFNALDNKKLGNVMIEALDACSNYGSDIGFEISPRNVAVKDGKIILLDCFFIISSLISNRKTRNFMV